MNKVIQIIKELLQVFIPAAAIALFLNTVVLANSFVPSPSMEPTIMTGDRIMGFRLSYLADSPQRGDVVIFRYPDNEKKNYVKRVIGLPGDRVVIDQGQVYINDVILEEDYLNEEMEKGPRQEFLVPADSYFVMGDNRNNSDDSRRWQNTYVKKEKIMAKVMFKYFPGIKGIE